MTYLLRTLVGALGVLLATGSPLVFASENVTWYLQTIKDISVEVSVPSEFEGDGSDRQYTSEQIAEWFEKHDVKEKSDSEHKYRLDVAAELLTEGRCRFTVKSEFIRPTTFRHRPQVDWTESDFVRGTCDAEGVWQALVAGFGQAIKLMRDKEIAAAVSETSQSENAAELGRAIGCAVGGGCEDDPVSSRSAKALDAQAGPEECMFDTQCSPGERCLKARDYGKGICAKLGRNASPVRCQFDVGCDPGYKCHKSDGGLYGVCLKK